MADVLPKYRFLPWARRGLAAAIPDRDLGGSLASRAQVPVAMTVTAIPPVGVNLDLYGPGDIIGVDPRLIVRTEPRPNVTDFEPNYLAAVDLDVPDFPWMFTPARANLKEQLRPWCVLVVLDQRVVAFPKVNRGAPLPTITVPAEAVATELPNLAESWAWAHAQVMSENEEVRDLKPEMTAEPHLNVSRLVCPRRLVPNQRYIACLVPAFDLGVQRGLGITPSGSSAMPAWDVAIPREVILPLYFHWTFATGPAGDFESLAGQLTPIKVSAEMGFQRMFVGAAGGGLADTPANNEASYLKMEGVLRAPSVDDKTSLKQVAPAMQKGLLAAINEPAARATKAETSSPPVSPPIYGGWHLNRHKVENTTAEPQWLQELNLDPRSRAAAALGAEVVRASQEEFMQAAWEQVGDVIKANELLNRSRFAIDVHRRTYLRHYVSLPQDRLFQLTMPLHARTLLTDKTVRAQITRTSVPDASVDPALRRLLSPQRPWLKTVARRGKFAAGPSRSVRSNLLASLATNKVSVDPTEFLPDGINGTALLDTVSVPSTATNVDLAVYGVQARLDVTTFKRMMVTRGELLKVNLKDIPRLTLRSDLAGRGVILRDQVTKIRDLQEETAGVSVSSLNLHMTLRTVAEVAKRRTDAAAVLVNAEPTARTLVSSLHVDENGNVLSKSRTGEKGIAVAVLAKKSGRQSRAAATMLSELPIGALRDERLPARSLPTIARDADRIVINDPNSSKAKNAIGRVPLTVVLRPPIKDNTVVTRFTNAFTAMSGAIRLRTVETPASFVAFDVKKARDILVARLNPDVMVPRRVRSMIGGEAGVALESIPGIRVLPEFDRIMVAPEIPAPMYSYLAKYDRERFLPGVGQLPPNSITLLETNPRFIEAFMVGLNYEMNRELLWREYPTDQRGTRMRCFWNRSDGAADLLDAIHRWGKGPLGSHMKGVGTGGQIVLLLRGQLLRRYPNTVIYAWLAKNGKLKDPPAPGDIKEPVFQGSFDPDVSFAGFDLNDSNLKDGDGWFFVLQEQPTEPRFGFDESLPVPLTAWSKATWDDVKVEPGKYISIASNPLKDKVIASVTFGKNSAHLAYILFQKPARAAIHSKYLAD